MDLHMNGHYIKYTGTPIVEYVFWNWARPVINPWYSYVVLPITNS